MIIIPIDSGDSFFEIQTPDCDGASYTLRFRWNIRAQAWFMDVLDAQGITSYLAGRRLCAGWPIGAYDTGRNPPGVFVAADTTGTGTDPGLDDLGARVQLVYLTAADLGL